MGRRVEEVRVAGGEEVRGPGWQGVDRFGPLVPLVAALSRWSHPGPVGTADSIVDSTVDSIVSSIVDSIFHSIINTIVN